MGLDSTPESVEITPRRIELQPGESPNQAALRELTDMGLIDGGQCVIPISVRSIPTRNTGGQSNVQRIWNGGTDGNSNETFFYPYNPKWGQTIQAKGRSYWFVRTDALDPTEPHNDRQSGTVRFVKPYGEALVLVLKEAE